jgi:ankyrin repeat protein
MSDVKTLHEQVKSGDLTGVRATLAGNPDLLNAKNESGQCALLLSQYYGRQEVAEYLLGLGPALDIFTAAAMGRADAVLSELDRDPALIGAHSTDGWTPLHLAAFFGRKDLAQSLIERGAEVDAQSTNAMKNTPLHAATAGMKAELVKLLLEEGANANARQEGGWTPLHGAAQNGDREIVEVLLAHHADLKARADNNQGPLDLALQKGHEDVAAMLQQLGAELQ